MYLTADTIDDLLNKVYRRLLRKRGAGDIVPTKGANTEIYGALLLLKNPRARLSQSERKNTVFSCLGEFLWYLSGSNKLDFIQYYIKSYSEFSDDNETIFGAYGPRLFGSDKAPNQVQNVIETLRASSTSRRAAIQLYHGEDLAQNLEKRRKDLPCTCTLQFTVRDHQLHAMVMMRSNDAFMGLPHDIFAFTMLQELIARSLGVEVGQYKHAVGSLHLYATDIQSVLDYLDEGYQERVLMPHMPAEDPWPTVAKVLEAERMVRQGKQPELDQLPSYWADLARLLQVYRYSRKGARQADREKLADIKAQMTTDVYDLHIAKRQRQAPMPVPSTPLLFDGAALDAQQPASADSNKR
ncbi:thymidylate synthase [Paraburkholderia strydomiana]|jgi:thymidylate synthase|uniref:thymidylate synthase n=1 Tax=Paraburkholderia strydomiana TaxID=1245417 RepID=UPI0028629E94|nr:thymidylate synthase [Paraburkholderia strydomiana]MDR7007012.1 thymidylate synthase [Paraburkholderia strydomiana]